MVKSTGKHNKKQYHGTKKRQSQQKARKPPRNQDFPSGVSATFDVAIISTTTKRRDHVIRRENARFPDGEGEALAEYFWDNCHEKHFPDF